MKPLANQPIACSSQPVLSSRDRGWDHIEVERFQHPAGEGESYFSDEHAICLSLAPRPVRLLQTQGDRTQTGLYGKGDICIIPVQMPFFARWDSDDRFVQIRIKSDFLQQVASETLETKSNGLELLSEFKLRDAHLEAIAMMLLAELKQEQTNNRLYVDSLANVFGRSPT